VIEIHQDTMLLLAGCAASCGVLLVAAGAGKAYRGARGIDGGSAIRRALRMPRRRWRRVETAAGGLECATGAAVCAGVYPAVSGAAMAGLGAVFCVVLGYVRLRQVPGGCGCLGWRAEAPADAVTWRAVARGGILLGAGVAAAVASRVGTFRGVWFYGGMLAGGVLLTLFSVRMPMRGPFCRGLLWRPARATARTLAGHEMFAAMAASAGPFAPSAGYRRAGCTEEFWFSPAASADDRPAAARAVVFEVRRVPPRGSLAVHAELRSARPGGSAWPARVIAAELGRGWAAESRHAAGREGEKP
jgi:hypothetical protein